MHMIYMCLVRHAADQLGEWGGVMVRGTRRVVTIAVLGALAMPFTTVQAAKEGEGQGACGTIPWGNPGGDPWHGGTGSTFTISGYVPYQSNLHGWNSDGTIGGTGHETCV